MIRRNAHARNDLMRAFYLPVLQALTPFQHGSGYLCAKTGHYSGGCFLYGVAGYLLEAASTKVDAAICCDINGGQPPCLPVTDFCGCTLRKAPLSANGEGVAAGSRCRHSLQFHLHRGSAFPPHHRHLQQALITRRRVEARRANLNRSSRAPRGPADCRCWGCRD